MHYQIKTLQKYIHQQYPVKNNGNKDFMDISQKKKVKLPGRLNEKYELVVY